MASNKLHNLWFPSIKQQFQPQIQVVATRVHGAERQWVNSSASHGGEDSMFCVLPLYWQRVWWGWECRWGSHYHLEMVSAHSQHPSSGAVSPLQSCFLRPFVQLASNLCKLTGHHEGHWCQPSWLLLQPKFDRTKPNLKTLRISRSNEQSPANAYTGSIFYELQVITFPI